MHIFEVVDLRKISLDGKLKALVSVKIGNEFILKGFTVLEGTKGSLSVAMPRKVGKDGRWFDLVEPLTEVVRRDLESTILEAYDRD